MKNLFFTITLLLGVLSMEAQINVDDGGGFCASLATLSEEDPVSSVFLKGIIL